MLQGRSFPPIVSCQVSAILTSFCSSLSAFYIYSSVHIPIIMQHSLLFITGKYKQRNYPKKINASPQKTPHVLGRQPEGNGWFFKGKTFYTVEMVVCIITVALNQTIFLFFNNALFWLLQRSLLTSVVDPDPHVFGSPGSGSTSQRYGSGSGSFYHHVK